MESSVKGTVGRTLAKHTSIAVPAPSLFLHAVQIALRLAIHKPQPLERGNSRHVPPSVASFQPSQLHGSKL